MQALELQQVANVQLQLERPPAPEAPISTRDTRSTNATEDSDHVE